MRVHIHIYIYICIKKVILKPRVAPRLCFAWIVLCFCLFRKDYSTIIIIYAQCSRDQHKKLERVSCGLCVYVYIRKIVIIVLGAMPILNIIIIVCARAACCLCLSVYILLSNDSPPWCALADQKEKNKCNIYKNS